MIRRLLVVLALIGALAVFAPSVMADNGKSQSKGKGKAHFDRDDDRWEHREGWEHRIYGPDEGRPPGWNKGNKTGWKNCGMPPGQAKKYGCRSYTYRNRRYYWYRDDVGRVIVRRPSIRIGGGIEVR